MLSNALLDTQQYKLLGFEVVCLPSTVHGLEKIIIGPNMNCKIKLSGVLLLGGLRILLSIGESMEESCSSSLVNDYGFKRKNDKHFDWTIYDSVFQRTKLVTQSKGHGSNA